MQLVNPCMNPDHVLKIKQNWHRIRNKDNQSRNWCGNVFLECDDIGTFIDGLINLIWSLVFRTGNFTGIPPVRGVRSTKYFIMLKTKLILSFPDVGSLVNRNLLLLQWNQVRNLLRTDWVQEIVRSEVLPYCCNYWNNFFTDPQKAIWVAEDAMLHTFMLFFGYPKVLLLFHLLKYRILKWKRCINYWILLNITCCLLSKYQYQVVVVRGGIFTWKNSVPAVLTGITGVELRYLQTRILFATFAASLVITRRNKIWKIEICHPLSPLFKLFWGIITVCGLKTS